MATKNLIVIVGPTGSGKTEAATTLAKRYNGEIICADSRTIYKDMNIITAKPNQDDMQAIKHYGLDLVSPDQAYTVKDFKNMADKMISEIMGKDKTPILVGGSGLYINSVVFDYNFPEIIEKIDDLPLNKLQKIATERGYVVSEQVFKNPRHLRGLLNRGGEAGKAKLKQNIIIYGIKPSLDVLKARITKRVEVMFDSGAVEEVEYLIKKYGNQRSAFNTPGFRPIEILINGEISEVEAKHLFAKADLDLAKKQIKWFKRYPEIKWFASCEDLLKETKVLTQNKIKSL